MRPGWWPVPVTLDRVATLADHTIRAERGAGATGVHEFDACYTGRVT